MRTTGSNHVVLALRSLGIPTLRHPTFLLRPSYPPNMDNLNSPSDRHGGLCTRGPADVAAFCSWANHEANLWCHCPTVFKLIELIATTYRCMAFAAMQL